MTLATLFASKNARKEDVASAAGVDPRLFDRIDSGLQPFQRVVAVPVADFLGVTVSEVLAEASAWTEDASEAGRRPFPVDPGLYGGRVDYAPMAMLAEPPVVMSPAAPSGWAVYNRPSNDSVLVRFHRDSGVLLDAVTLTGDLIGARAVLDMTTGGGKIFVVASAGGGAAYRIDAASGQVEEQSLFDYSGSTAIEFEPASSTLWIARKASERLSRIRVDGMIPAADVTLTFDFVDWDPADLCELGGSLFVLGTDPAGDAYVFRVDPATDSVTGVSADILTDASAICAGGGFVWVAFSTLGSPLIYRLDPATMTGTPIPVTGGAQENVSAALFFSDRVWTSERTTLGSPKWTAIRTDGTVAAATTYSAAAGDLGRAATDGVFFWAPHAGSILAPDGLERINPNDYQSVLQARPAQPVDASRDPAVVLFA